MRTMRICALLITTLWTLQPCSVSATDSTLDPTTRTRVLENIATLIETRYAEPELASELAAGLRRRTADGAYDAYAAPRDLAGRLSEELRASDAHFDIQWTPPGAEAMTDHPAHDSAQRDRWIARTRRHNFGFRRVEVLPGNVGYLDLEVFDDVAYAGDTAVAAMRFLAGTDALIIDLRHNGGGEPSMVHLLASFLFDDTPVELTGLWRREGEKLDRAWTLAYLPGPRLPKVPVWVLTARRTGSAAEAFAYDLQTLHRATIVGQRTVGAANPGDVLEVGDGFSIFISTGRALNPVTGTNWQGTGVAPDVEVDAEAAFTTARRLALEALEPTAKDALHQREIRWAREELDAREHLHRLAPAELAVYVGTFGDRRIWLEDGILRYQRAQRSPRRMQPLGDDRFLHEGVEGFRTRFERAPDGEVLRLVDEWVDGHVEPHIRRLE